MPSAPITYIEIPTRSLTNSKAFFKQAFGWLYRDLNQDYSYITNAGVPCAFYRSHKTAQGAILLVLQVTNLDTAQANVIAAGGQIIKPPFTFPGGHRFHFTDNNGNEFAAWAQRSMVDLNRDNVQMG